MIQTKSSLVNDFEQQDSSEIRVSVINQYSSKVKNNLESLISKVSKLRRYEPKMYTVDFDKHPLSLLFKIDIMCVYWATIHALKLGIYVFYLLISKKTKASKS